MDISNISKEKHEEVLLQYIDIPYFRNNPTYIEWWRIYYQKYKDPQILILMYHKQISAHYHWLYIELSEHFMRKNKPQIAHFILSEALKNNVYDPVKINEFIERIPQFERKYTRGDMLSILNWKNINALGRVWNVSKEEVFSQNEQNRGIVNFEIEKIKNYEGRLCFKKYSEKSGFSSVDWKFKETGGGVFEETYECVCNNDIEKEDNLMNENRIIDQNEIQSSTDEIDQKNTCEIEINENSSINSSFIDENTVSQDNNHNEAVSKENEIIFNKIENTLDEKITISFNNDDTISKKIKHESSNSIFEIDPHLITGSLEEGQDVCIDNYIYLVQATNRKRILLLKMAKNSDITQTLLGKTMCMMKSSQESCKIFKNVCKYEVCRYENEYYLMYEYDCLCNIKDFIHLSSLPIKMFYLKKIIEKLIPLKEIGYLISDPLGFFVNQKFDIEFECVDVVEDSCEVENTLKTVFSDIPIPININLETFKYLDENTNTPAAKKEILRHKTDILQSI